MDVWGRNDPRCVAAFTHLDMAGTAAPFLRAARDGAAAAAAAAADDDVFAVAFGRSCPAPLDAPGAACHVLDAADVPSDARIGGDGGRCYANPLTAVGPPPEEMLMPTLLVFDPAARAPSV